MWPAETSIQSIRKKIETNKPITENDALKLALMEKGELMELFALANSVRTRIGDTVNTCSIINAKYGSCPQDCSFCAQSVHNRSQIEAHQILKVQEMVQMAKTIKQSGVQRIGIVTSGHHIQETELEGIIESVRMIKESTGISICTSIGTLTPGLAKRLKQAGVERIHHNLETSRNFFNNICTTHSFEERVNTIRVAKENGFKVCCGGIIGVGESIEDRIDLALTLRELDVDTIPINILDPIPGTPLEDAEPLEPMEILRTIAIFRLILPDKGITIAGGREKNLRSLQPLALMCGANGLMLGNYLTTSGQDASTDLEMIRDTGLLF